MVATHRPVRTCIGCRTRRPQAELVRVAATAGGRIVISRGAPGRGAWLCIPPEDCWRQAVKRRAFERAMRRPVTVAQEIEVEAEQAAEHSDGIHPVTGRQRPVVEVGASAGGRRGRGTE